MLRFVLPTEQLVFTGEIVAESEAREFVTNENSLYQAWMSRFDQSLAGFSVEAIGG